MVCGVEPHERAVEAAWDSVSPPLSASPLLVHTHLSLRIYKYTLKEKKTGLEGHKGGAIYMRPHRINHKGFTSREPAAGT